MNPQPLQASPYVGASQIPMDVTGVDEIAGFNGGREECVDGGAREDRKSSAMAVSRTSELTISFEGEVYVFPAVTPEKVQSIPFSNLERESCICALKLCFVLERDDCLSSSIAFQWNRVPRAISKEKKCGFRDFLHRSSTTMLYRFHLHLGWEKLLYELELC